jgi:hypothetical protein
MINTDKLFYGQQEDEKILYTVKPHYLSPLITTFKLYIICAAVFIALLILGATTPSVPPIIFSMGVIVCAVVAIFGTKIIQNYNERSISYITDRRLVRFEPTTFFATNIRSLSWDEAVKVKTFSPNLLWKQLMVGTVVVHARTTVKTSDENQSHTSADDIEINDVYLYRDLGNYIDKILFTYKQLPKDVGKIHPFVPKPKGQRY